MPRFIWLSLTRPGHIRQVDQHIAWAVGAGVTGFCSSWWGRGSFEDGALALLLARAAHRNARAPQEEVRVAVL